MAFCKLFDGQILLLSISYNSDELSCYDKSSKPILLSTAKEFADWITSIKPDDITYRINLLQIIKRERELNNGEKFLLRTLLQEQPDENYYVAIYLLLEDYESANLHFAQLSHEDKERFKSYPIFNFFDNVQIFT
jgi:hypothetical protein